MTEKSRPAR